MDLVLLLSPVFQELLVSLPLNPVSKLLSGLAMAAVATVAAVAALPAQAQNAQSNYPNRPIKLVVSQAPGGSSDTIARLWAEHAGKGVQQGGGIHDAEAENKARLCAGDVGGFCPDREGPVEWAATHFEETNRAFTAG